MPRVIEERIATPVQVTMPGQATRTATQLPWGEVNILTFSSSAPVFLSLPQSFPLIPSPSPVVCNTAEEIRFSHTLLAS